MTDPVELVAGDDDPPAGTPPGERSRRWRSRWALRPALLVPLVAGAWWLAASASAAPARPAQAPTALEAQGQELFARGCSSCHGLTGAGVDAAKGDTRGPSLKRSGTAIAYYELSTGRMPLAAPDNVPRRKQPAYDAAEIKALVAYVGTLGNGAAIPRVNVGQGSLAEGGSLYRANCQACHSATGAGGALSYGRAAPSLGQATALQIGSAVRSGPGQMPVFGDETLSARDVDSIARYVRYLEDPDDRGGIALGRVGPIPEGFLIWVVGIGTLLIACVWIGKRAKDRKEAPTP